MPRKVINLNFSVNLARKGEPVVVKKGEVFDFTDDEIADIERAQGEDALRDPINEEDEKPKKQAKPTKTAPAQNTEL